MPLPAYPVTGHLVIKVYEVVDIANLERVTSELTELLYTCPEPAVILDIRSRYLTGAGIDVLTNVHGLAHCLGLRLQVAVRHPLARRILAITGADFLLEVHPDLPTALQAA